MKPFLKLVCITLPVLSAPAFGQWTPNGSSIYYNGGNVGIGTITPSSKIQVDGNLSTTNGRFSSLYSQNSDGIYPGNIVNVPGDAQLSIGANWTGGLTDLSLINSNLGNTSAGGFSFWQMTGPSSKKLLTYFQGNGNVGIGTAYPASRLQVEGNFSTTTGRFSSLYSQNTDGAYPTNSINVAGDAQLSIGANWTSGQSDLSLVNSNIFNSSNGGFSLWQLTAANTKRMLAYFRGDGNVAIGSLINPPYKLTVDGTVGAREVRVTQATWSDFVFDESYKLPTLKSVEKLIRRDKHLPGIPSATDVKTNGISLGDMDAKLLQKIEELTLYIIEQQKRIERLENRQTSICDRSVTVSR